MRRIVAAAGLLVMAVVMVAVPADAVDTVEGGWWWREQPADGTLPPPPQVPEGGLRIASDATGPSAIAAVRIALAAGDRNPILTLKVAAGSLDGLLVTACPAASAWKPAAGGAWSSRPQADCAAGSVAGSPSADGKALVFDLSSLPSADVVLATAAQRLPVDPSPLPVPDEAPPTADLSFAKPSAADVAVTSAPVDETAPDSAAPPVDAPAFDAAPLDLGSAPVDAVVPSPAAAPVPSATPAPAPAHTGAPLARLGAPAAPAYRPVASLFDPVDEKRDRLLAAFVFADLLVGWWLLERRRGTVVDATGRPRLSLHDDPAIVLAAHSARRRPTVAVDVPPLR